MTKQQTYTRLSIEIGTRLTIGFDGFEGRISCNLIGIKPGAFLIVDMPAIEMKKTVLDGAKGGGRYLYFGNIFSFKTKILKSQMTPARLLFLSYPDMVETHSLRKHKRVNCYIPASGTIDDVQFEGLIMDLSSEGCQFVLKMSKLVVESVMNLEDTVEIDFAVKGMEEPGTIQTVVKRIYSDSEKTALGLQFKSLDEEFLDRINEYLEMIDDFTPRKGVIQRGQVSV